MKRGWLATIVLPLVLAACATIPRDRGGADWLVGRWLMLGPATEYPLSCESDEPIVYAADGRYQTYGESGTWRLDHERLVETAAEIDGEPVTTDPGRTAVSQAVRTGPDVFRKTYADGTAAIFRRCPP